MILMYHRKKSKYCKVFYTQKLAKTSISVFTISNLILKPFGCPFEIAFETSQIKMIQIHEMACSFIEYFVFFIN